MASAASSDRSAAATAAAAALAAPPAMPLQQGLYDLSALVAWALGRVGVGASPGLMEYRTGRISEGLHYSWLLLSLEQCMHGLAESVLLGFTVHTVSQGAGFFGLLGLKPRSVWSSPPCSVSLTAVLCVLRRRTFVGLCVGWLRTVCHPAVTGAFG